MTTGQICNRRRQPVRPVLLPFFSKAKARRAGDNCVLVDNNLCGGRVVYRVTQNPRLELE